jgi:hypothetical protein
MYNMGTLLRHGSKAQKDLYLPKIASGEWRLQSMGVTEPTAGTDKGNIIGLGYSAYDGSRNLTAAYAEVLAPVTPMGRRALTWHYAMFDTIDDETARSVLERLS